MCIAAPAKVVEINREKESLFADFGGVRQGDVKAMTAELQKIGTNINQIAKRVNAAGTLYAPDIEDIKGAMAEICLLYTSRCV